MIVNEGNEKSGPPLERVQRVQLHPSIYGNGCSAPVLKSAISSILITFRVTDEFES